MKSWQNWLKGLVAAIITGATNGVSLVIVAPETFNLKEGAGKLIGVSAVQAIIGAAFYLKQSPLPGCGPETEAAPK